jgi:hypothetical protein
MREMSVVELSVRTSGIHGNGVFTEVPVRAGQLVACVEGSTRTVDGALLYTPEEAEMNPNWLGVTPTTWIVPDEPYVFINHSCDPTCGLRGLGDLHALRDLQPGDEITIDYSVSEANPYWHMDCSCGSPRCQRRLRSIAYLPQETYDRYYPFIPDALADFYTRYRKKGSGSAGPSTERAIARWLRRDLRPRTAPKRRSALAAGSPGHV